ncbi:MAG: hypothetical protein HFH08_05765 [Bacilli bacterium]|nr:hypothetical protein [Bacilli bacterium]
MTAYLNTVTIKRLVDIIVIILIILVIRKRRIKLSRTGRRNLLIGIVILVIFLEIGISLLEIKFLTFKNLRQAFVYNFPEYKLKESIVKEEAGFVIFEDGNSLSVMKYENKNNHWKYKNTFYKKTGWDIAKSYRGYSIGISSNYNSSIYLIFISYRCFNEITISDNYTSDFVSSKWGGICYQYTIIKNPPNEYYIMLGDDKYNLNL